MSADKGNNIRWVATRKVDDSISTLYHIQRGIQTRDLQKYLTLRQVGQKYMKESGLKGTVRKY